MKTTRRTLPRRTFLGLAAGAAAIPIAGCAPGGSTKTQSSSAPTAVQTDPSAIPSATLRMLDAWTDKTSLQAQWITKCDTAFTAKYPHVTITRTSAAFDDINKTLKLKLSDVTAPDIVPANNGWQGLGNLAKARLILNLDPYAKAYGWDTRIPKTVAMQQQVSADGTQIGTGSFFGMPVAQGGFITVNYNRAKLAKLSLQPPKTFDDFSHALAAAKAAGEIPMMIGTQDQYLSTTTLFALMHVYASKDAISNFVYGIGGSAAGTGLKDAAATYQGWAKSGYLPSNFAGTSGADSGQAFVDGKGVFYFYYSDSLPFRSTKVADQFGAFLLPTQPLHATGATNQNFSIATRSKHPDAAAAYLDFVSSEEAGKLAMETGLLPFNGPFTAPAGAGALLKDEVGELNAVQQTDGFVPYFDWSSPTMLDTLGAQAQLLLGGKATPDDVVTACQKDYDAFRKTQGK